MPKFAGGDENFTTVTHFEIVAPTTDCYSRAPMIQPRSAILLVLAAALFAGCDHGEPPIKGPITFNKHIAPIVFTHCASCHRPGGTAPFTLLAYSDVKKRASLILDVTGRRYMPPWLPDEPRGAFLDENRLSDAQLALLKRWSDDGLLEGNPADLPAMPEFPTDWPLGKPDLVVTLSEPFIVPAEGPDIYRNFVLPLGNKQQRWVRATDMRAKSAAVHHGLMAFDKSKIARRWDERDAAPGFASFTLPPNLELPPHFLAWVPGRRARQVQPGLQWQLAANSDLVLQLHLRSTGKREEIRPEVAFYFTDIPPTNQPYKLQTTTLKIAIPAGATNYIVRTTFPIAGDADILAIHPHAHFLATEMMLRLRDAKGETRTLLHIPRWDFNWQEAYRFAKPVFASAGSMLEADITYDNSTNNPANPNHPPKLVRYGLESTDEMAVMSVQFLPRDKKSADAIHDSLVKDLLEFTYEFNTHMIEREPTNSNARVGLGRHYYIQKNYDAAAQQLAIARQLDPRNEDAAILAGIVAQMRGRADEARFHFEDCIRLNSDHVRAHGCMAVMNIQLGQYDIAEKHIYELLRIDSSDADAKSMLQQVKQMRRR
jgi:hypothetical protein